MDEQTVPFLRWPGGKRWLAPTLAPAVARVLADSGGTYHEPFLGAGAVALALAPARAVLSDANAELIRAFRFVRDWPERVLDIVAAWPVDEETYYRIRADHHLSGIRAAARFVYLNRTCYGGLHRTNKLGLFTAAYGGGSRTTEPLFREKLLERAAATLDRPDVHLLARGWRGAFRDAVAGDVIYCDPPYAAKARGAFDRYGAEVFSWDDQEELAAAAVRARLRGVTVIVSNGARPEIAELYSSAIPISFWKRKRVGNRAADDSTHDEPLYVLDPDEDREDMWLSLQKSPGEAYGPRRRAARQAA